MNFNRYSCQEFIESEVGCADPTQLQTFKEQIRNYTLPPDKVLILKEALSSDAIDVFYKSALSFLEVLYSLKRGHSSWAIVKLYYSVFYSLRCFLLLNSYAPIKNGKGEIYFIKCEANSPTIKISTGSIKGDHKTTIRAFNEFFPMHKLNTNKIESDSIFDWAMQCRELVNYRNSSFIEPDYGYEAIPGLMAECSKVDNLLRQYVESEYYSFCFDKEHSMLSTATVLLKENIVFFRDSNIPFLTPQRASVIYQLLRRTKLLDSVFLKSLFLNDTDVLTPDSADE